MRYVFFPAIRLRGLNFLLGGKARTVGGPGPFFPRGLFFEQLDDLFRSLRIGLAAPVEDVEQTRQLIAGHDGQVDDFLGDSDFSLSHQIEVCFDFMGERRDIVKFTHA